MVQVTHDGCRRLSDSPFELAYAAIIPAAYSEAFVTAAVMKRNKDLGVRFERCRHHGVMTKLGVTITYAAAVTFTVLEVTRSTRTLLT